MGVKLLYNVMLVLLYGKVNQLDMYIDPLPFGPLSHSGHHGALSSPC